MMFVFQATFGSLSNTTTSIFYDTSAINNPNNYYILNQYSISSKFKQCETQKFFDNLSY